MIENDQKKSIHTINLNSSRYEIESKNYYGLSVSLVEDSVMLWQGSNFYFIKDVKLCVFDTKTLVNRIFNFNNKSIIQTELSVIFYDCTSEKILYEFDDEDVIIETNIPEKGTLEIINFNQKKSVVKFDLI